MNYRIHPNRSLLEQYLDEDLPAGPREKVEHHLASCSACRREVLGFRALFADLARLPLPEVPMEFDARVLRAVLLRPSQDALLVRMAARAYLALATVLAVLGLSALTSAAIRTGSVQTPLAESFTRLIDGGIGILAFVGNGFLSVAKAGGDIFQTLGFLQPLLRGLGVAAGAVAPQVWPVAVMTLALAALVLYWATSTRERGVPHVRVSL
jgi:predicted anti-sigma-YlaC factor YlaD